MTSMLKLARSRLNRISTHCDVSDEALLKLSYPQRTLSASIPLRRDNGRLLLLKAWRCQFNDLLGPTKGGIRFHPSVHIDEVMTLAFWMTLKTALADLPYGGSKGGVQVDATELSTMELERLARGYAEAFATMIGPDSDIPAPDMYTNEMTMAWMADEYAKTGRVNALAAFTGKPVSRGGSQGRSTATSTGAFYAFNRLRDTLSIPKTGARIAVQGFGNAGRTFCELMSDAGHKVVAVSDSSGAIVDDDGLDIKALVETKTKEGKVFAHDKKGAKKLDADDLLTLEVDLLVPAALPNVIDASLARDLKAGAILELANGPVHPEADETLQKRSIPVVPDILANSGGVIVSYFEWVQNRTGDYWSAETVDERLKQRIENSADAVVEAAKAEDLGLRDAANLVALRRLSDASRSLGTHSDYRD